MSSDAPIKSTMIGTRCHIVTQVAIRTRPPAQFAIDASITSSFNMTLSPGYSAGGYGSALYCQVLCVPSALATAFRWSSGLLPGAPSASHRTDVPVSHLLEVVRRQRRTKTPSTIENQLGVFIGDALFDVALDHALS